MCTKEVNALARAGLIEMNEVDISPTPPGKLMARYCISFDTMKTFLQAVLGCQTIVDPGLNNESLKIMRLGQRLTKFYHLITKMPGRHYCLSAGTPLRNPLQSSRRGLGAISLWCAMHSLSIEVFTSVGC
ncbi:hypothetical protein SK128_003895 [Halocaridina rubra]|uniref:Uncharacterized protein n=1 Tax=Halocaridina rubra TaxID=373956 RepID=A0AAN8WL20_HALRR